MRRFGAPLLAALVAAPTLVWSPGPSDLAAASFRADLFAEHGIVVWNLSWFAGHPTLGYSVLAPPLMALLGPRLVAATSAVAAAWLFASLVRDEPGGRVAAPWFAVVAGAWCWTGRVPFLLGAAFALGALALATRRRAVLGGLAAAASVLSSPLTGAFLALAALGWGAADRTRRATAAAVGAGAVLPGAAVALSFPERGTHPFDLAHALPPLGVALAVALLAAPRHRALRIAAALYAVVVLACLVVPNGVGGNVTRLGALFGGPLVVLALWEERRRAALALAAPLLWFGLYPAVRDTVIAAGDPSDARAFHAPLLRALDGAGAQRTEVVPLETHWESARIAPRRWIARGWLRQLDRERNPLFHDGSLTGPRLAAWLRENAVDTIALADAPLDSAGEDEARLLRAGAVPGLRELPRPSAEWRLWRVEGARPLVEDVGRSAVAVRLTRRDAASFSLAGRGLVRVRFSRWLDQDLEGCPERAGRWTVAGTPDEGGSVSSSIVGCTGDLAE